MLAEENPPCPNWPTMARHFHECDRRGGFEAGLDIVNQAAALSVANEEGTVAGKQIDTPLAVRLIVIVSLCGGRGGDKFVVTGPKRKLIQKILRFDQVNRRMTRAGKAPVAEIKRNLGGAVAIVGNEE